MLSITKLANIYTICVTGVSVIECTLDGELFVLYVIVR